MAGLSFQFYLLGIQNFLKLALKSKNNQINWLIMSLTPEK